MYSPLERTSGTASVGCCVFFRRPSSLSRLGYRALPPADFSDGEDTPVKVVVGKERREFLVDPFVLEKEPFRVLMEMVVGLGEGKGARRNGAIFVDVDHILFEHMLWSVYSDYSTSASSSSSSSSSLFRLNLKEIIEFYSQDN